MFVPIFVNLFIVMYFTLFIYFATSKKDWKNKTEDLSLFDSLYVTMSSVSTVGYGDFVPITNKAKYTMIAIQAIILLGIITIFDSMSKNEFTYRLLLNVLFTYTMIFAFTFFFTQFTEKSDWNFPMTSDTNNFTNMLYFTQTSFSTCGYGDIIPVTKKSKTASMFIQVMVMLQVLNLFTDGIGNL